MIGKVITLNKRGGVKRGFGPIIAYIARDDRDPGSDGPASPSTSELGLINLEADLETSEDRALVAELMNATAAQAQKRNRFRGNPVYHVALNWMEGEHPSTVQVDAAVQHLMKAVGLQECEALWALHRDTDYDHVHVVINRIHPETGCVVGPGPYDYFKIDKACREIELAQGWQHAPGPYVVEVGPQGPEIVRRVGRERSAPKICPKAQQAARNQGVPSFQEWVARNPAHALREVWKCGNPTWADLHRALAEFGLPLTPKGSGLIVTTPLSDGRLLAAKASQLGRDCSKIRLEERLGPFQPRADPILNIPTQETYAVFVARIQRGDDSGMPDTKSKTEGKDDDPQRSSRRAERAQARAVLYERFKTEQEILKVRRRAARQDLTKRHRQERAELKASLTARRPVFRAGQQAAGVPARIIAALWAFEAAHARETLQRRQRTERHPSGRLPKGSVWRLWLEAQASLGDEAARSALRGIRYREQRAKARGRNGIEGEDLSPLQPVLSSLHAEIDYHRQRVHYRNERGQILFTDTGPRIEVHDHTDTTLEAALRVAAQKFGGHVDITGSKDFRQRAARMAARLDIGVRDPDLQPTWEAERQAMERTHPQVGPQRTPDPDSGMKIGH